MTRLSVEDLIDRYLSDIEYLSDQDDIDSDDRIVINVYTDVIGDLRQIG